MSDQFFGWELLFNNVRNKIHKKEDVLMLLIHYSLIKCGFRCVGVNDDWNPEVEEILSELLPEEWNSGEEYVFKYKYHDQKFILRSCHSDNSTIIFNLMPLERLKVSSLMFNYEESVSALEGDIATVLPNYKDLFEAIHRDLVSTYVSAEKKNADTQTTSSEIASTVREDPLFVRTGRVYRNIEPQGIPDIGNIGRRDLDPLASIGMGGSSGMLFDPFEANRRRLLQGGIAPGPNVPQRLPREAIPDGARFSHFGPPDVGGSSSCGPGRYPREYDDMFS